MPNSPYSVGGGAYASIVTDYPFDDVATVVVISPTSVPLYLRIPGWANNASINVNGESNYYPTNGTMYKVGWLEAYTPSAALWHGLAFRRCLS